MENQQKDKIEFVEDQEYADMILTYVQFHATDFRNPKEWYPELVYNSKLHQGAKISTQIQNLSMSISPNLGLIITGRFPMSKEQTEKYKNAANSGKKFKIYAPKDKMIKITFDENLKEAMRSSNRKVGFEQYKIMEGRGELLSLDIEDGTFIIKLAVRS